MLRELTKFRLYDVEWVEGDQDLDQSIRLATGGADYLIFDEVSSRNTDWSKIPIGTYILDLYHGKICNLRRHMRFEDSEIDRNEFLRDAKNTDLIMKWPESNSPRNVQITVSTWRGLAVGASHWKGELREEDNHVWIEDRKKWNEYSGHKNALGRLYQNDTCSSEEEAQEYIKYILVKHFGNTSRYKVCFRSTKFELGTNHAVESMDD